MAATIAALLFVAAMQSAPAADPVAQCRSTHANDPTGQIACLEAALRLATAAGAPTVAPAGSATGPEGIGAEQVRARDSASAAQAKVQETVRIVSASYDRQEHGLFRTATGQLWRETERSPMNARLSPRQEYEARIERTAVGGYRMYVQGVRRMLKVERLE